MNDDLTALVEQYLREWDIAFQRGALTFTEDAALIRELYAALTVERQAREQAEQEQDRLREALRSVVVDCEDGTCTLCERCVSSPASR